MGAEGLTSEEIERLRKLVADLRSDAQWLGCEFPTVDLEIQAAAAVERLLSVVMQAACPK
jgi:hypothetical protein